MSGNNTNDQGFNFRLSKVMYKNKVFKEVNLILFCQP